MSATKVVISAERRCRRGEILTSFQGLPALDGLWESIYSGVQEYRRGVQEYRRGVREYRKGVQEYRKGVQEYRSYRSSDNSFVPEILVSAKTFTVMLASRFMLSLSP